MEKKGQENKDFSLEEGFQTLDELMGQLEGKELALEEAFTVYARGMEVLKQCNDAIDRVEKKMLVLNEQSE